MENSPNNPASNKLGNGVSDDDLQAAIEASGYPLQSTVVDTILNNCQARDLNCTVQEEWSFIDSDEGTVRQLDALVSCRLLESLEDHEPGIPSDPRGFLRHSADFLIECKQSDLPYVFFLRKSQVGDIPRLAGIPYAGMSFGRSPGERFIGMSTSIALGLYDLPFRGEPPTAISMSKAHRKGKALELSGEESFRSLALPIIKALNHYLRIVEPNQPRRLYFDVRAVFPLAVLKAPMIGVRMENDSIKMQALPWVRLVRVEPDETRNGQGFSHPTSFDVVHLDYLTEYLQMALDAAFEIASRASLHAIPIITGSALIGVDESNGEEHEDEESQDEEYFLQGAEPSMTQEEFYDFIRQKWTDVHSPVTDSANDEIDKDAAE